MAARRGGAAWSVRRLSQELGDDVVEVKRGARRHAALDRGRVERGSGHDPLDLVVVVAGGGRMGPHEPEESQRVFGITAGESPVRLDEHAEEQ